MSTELKELIDDANVEDLMNTAFSDLRADYELSIDASAKKIEELEQTNVDVDNHLQNLISYSKNSSGIISGLRGTGKTHLFLLARSSINKKFFNDPKSGMFCVYLNAKRITIPKADNQTEVFNRVFSMFIYDEFAVQLKTLLSDLRDKTLAEKFSDFFNKDKRKMTSNLEEAIKKIIEFKEIVKSGTSQLKGISAITVTEENFESELLELAANVNFNLSSSGVEYNSSLNDAITDEISKKISEDKDKIEYISYSTVRAQLISIMKLLNIQSVVFYIDEWEKLYDRPEIQKEMASYINHIIDNPLYFWIGVVPNRGSLAPLTIGADLQHTINLDESLIYENSDVDRRKCIDYFSQFVNKRLDYSFRGTDFDKKIDVTTLFNKPHNFELLVLASMGNSRDFGTMLAQCWSEYRAYRKAGRYNGRPYKYFSEDMVISAIQYSGNQKKQNILQGSSTKAVWDDLENFCIDKGSSHFVIEESQECQEYLEKKEFSDLIYHRLLHFRKAHLTQKDGDKTKKVSLYALDYASIYNLHATKKQIKFIDNSTDIHNSVRRYLYAPGKIINVIQIKSGEVVPCKSCHKGININQMKAVWEINYCPYCGGKIY